MRKLNIKNLSFISAVVIGTILTIGIGGVYYIIGALLAGLTAGFIGNIGDKGTLSGFLSGLFGVIGMILYSFNTGNLLWHIKEFYPYDKLTVPFTETKAFMWVIILAIIVFLFFGTIGGIIGGKIEDETLENHISR